MPNRKSVLSPNLSLRLTVRKSSLRSKGGIVVTQNRIGGMLVYEAKTRRTTGIEFGGRSPKALDPRDFR
jgi:hypothetical protein